MSMPERRHPQRITSGRCGVAGGGRETVGPCGEGCCVRKDQLRGIEQRASMDRGVSVSMARIMGVDTGPCERAHARV